MFEITCFSPVLASDWLRRIRRRSQTHISITAFHFWTINNTFIKRFNSPIQRLTPENTGNASFCINVKLKIVLCNV